MSSEPRKVIAEVGRAKSMNDIYEQRDRIIAGSQGNRSRIERAANIARTYASNIAATEQFRLDMRPQSERVAEAVAEARRRGYTTAQEANADKELKDRYGTFQNDFFGTRIPGVFIPENRRLMGRPYSRSVYMNNR